MPRDNTPGGESTTFRLADFTDDEGEGAEIAGSPKDLARPVAPLGLEALFVGEVTAC